MNKITIDYNNFQHELNKLNLHDAELRDIYCDYYNHKIEIPLKLSNPENRNVLCKLNFTSVLNLNVSFLEPWGPGIYINEFTITEGEGEFERLLCCKVLLNSGDSITVVSSKVEFLIGDNERTN